MNINDVFALYCSDLTIAARIQHLKGDSTLFLSITHKRN